MGVRAEADPTTERSVVRGHLVKSPSEYAALAEDRITHSREAWHDSDARLAVDQARVYALLAIAATNTPPVIEGAF